MKENDLLPLQAISPTTNYKDFYYNYHKRKKPVLLLKDLPQIKKNSSKNFRNINNTIKTENIFSLPILSQRETNSTFSPRFNGNQFKIKNNKFRTKNKIEKKKEKLSIKYIDIIRMNEKNKLLNYEISKSSNFGDEIIKHIHDNKTKNKVLNEINAIDNNTNEEIDKIMNNTTKKEKEQALNFFKANPKIINLSAAEILKEFNTNKNINELNKSNNNIKVKKKLEKNKNKKSKENINDKFVGDDFLTVAKNNIRRKIELRNEYNQELTVEYIEFLLKYEIEKLKMLLSIDINENQNDDILFNLDDKAVKMEDITGKFKNKKNLLKLDKSIKKLIQLNNYYNAFFGTNNNEENNTNNINNKLMTNENTQSNFKELFNEKRNGFNTENKYLDKDKYNNDYINVRYGDKNKYNNDISNKNNKNLFHMFKSFSRDKNINAKSINLKTSNNYDKNDLNNENNENIELGRLNSNNKEEYEQKNFFIGKNNLKLINSKSSRITAQKEKMISMSNKDIFSLLDKIKYKNKNNDIITKNENNKENYKVNDKENDNEIYKENINTKLNKNATNIKNRKYTRLINNNKDENYNDINGENNKLEGKEENNLEENEENNNLEENEESEEEEEKESSSENEDENKANKEFKTSHFTNKKSKNKKQENKTNIIPQNTEENDNNNNNDINNININNDNNNYINDNSSNNNINTISNTNSINNSPLQSIENQNEKNTLNKTGKKSKSKKRKKKVNKQSQDKIKQTEETSDSKYEQSNTNTNDRSKKNILLNNEIILTNKSQNKNKNKKISIINTPKKSKNVFSTGKKSIFSKKGRRTLISDIEKIKIFRIKDFEVIKKDEKKIKRNLSHHNLSTLENKDEMNLKGEINVLKLNEEDLDQLVAYINEEERRKSKIKENTEKQRQIKKRKSSLYSLFKVKEKKEAKKNDDITKEVLIDKLKKDDWRIRQYIEDIIMAGLTLGNNDINKRMKNKTILVFRGNNLGTFKFKKNFGIKEDVEIEPFRPLSHDKRDNEDEDKEKKQKEKLRNIIRRESKIKHKEEMMNEKEKKRLKKLEEARKKLIYDNRYLLEKKKPSIKFILRKEVEEILHGGLFLQKLAKTEEEKTIEMTNRFLPKRKKFVKKKKYRAKLFKKSNFLKEVMTNDVIIPINENNYSDSESEIKEESDHSFEDKMQTFINRIKKLKKGEEFNFHEIERILNPKNLRNQKEKVKQMRMREFLSTLNEYRDINKNQRIKNNYYSYKVPILITTSYDGDKFSIMDNSKY